MKKRKPKYLLKVTRKAMPFKWPKDKPLKLGYTEGSIERVGS